MKLRKLVFLQIIFAIVSLTYLLTSAWLEHTTGAALSAAPMLPSLVLFGLYLMSLFLVKLPRKLFYRIAMGFAILFFGGGGVIGNILRYMGSGLEQYASFGAWAIAVAINAFGTVWNVLAVFGKYHE